MQNYKKFCTFASKFEKKIIFLVKIMENNTFETALMDPEEREQVEFMLSVIPEQDRKNISADDVLFVLDMMDDYLLEEGLLEYNEETEEAVYLDGEVDETEQLNYVLNQAQQDERSLTASQIQIIMDAEQQWGLKQGYYEVED